MQTLPLSHHTLLVQWLLRPNSPREMIDMLLGFLKLLSYFGSKDQYFVLGPGFRLGKLRKEDHRIALQATGIHSPIEPSGFLQPFVLGPRADRNFEEILVDVGEAGFLDSRTEFVHGVYGAASFVAAVDEQLAPGLQRGVLSECVVVREDAGIGFQLLDPALFRMGKGVSQHFKVLAKLLLDVVGIGVLTPGSRCLNTVG